jgi:predicted negative regulator of RcsB-dependent stress response
MATNLDLQQQEQLESFKAFWRSYGNLITWTLILALGAFGGWRWWENRQAQQGLEAGGMYEALDRAVAAADLDKTARVLADLQQRFPNSAYAAQGAMLAAKQQAENGQADAAKASLGWVVTNGTDADLKAMARLRLAAVYAEAKAYDEALKLLAEPVPAPFEALRADRQGDLLLLQGQQAEAIQAYQRAQAAMSDQVDYRRFIEAKLAALGAPVGAAGAGGAAASAPASGAASASAPGASK